MKKLIENIVKFWNKSINKTQTSAFVGIIIIISVLSKNANSNVGIIFMVICVVVMLISIIISILKHEDIMKTLIYFIIGFMAILIIIAYYFIGKGVDFDIFLLIFPILLMTLGITGYFHVKKSGDKERIKQIKISLMIIFGQDIEVYYYS